MNKVLDAAVFQAAWIQRGIRVNTVGLIANSIGGGSNTYPVLTRLQQFTFERDAFIIGVSMVGNIIIDPASANDAVILTGGRNQGPSARFGGTTNQAATDQFINFTYILIGTLPATVNAFTKSLAIGFDPPFCPFFPAQTGIATYANGTVDSLSAAAAMITFFFVFKNDIIF